MRYCIISDIHGNLEALLSVMKKIKSYGEQIDRIICLGDIVGYGADPAECIRLTRKISDVILAGNHDFAVCDQTSIEDFNTYAKEAVLWSRKQLTKNEIDFLKGLPFEHSDKNAVFVHSSLHRPESWRYLSGTPDTYIDFQIMEKKILFVGHTHVPVIFENARMEVKRLNLPKLTLDSEKKYIINPGSVGQPRNRDPRASFAIFDTGNKSVETIPVEYDIQKAQDKILNAGLPEVLATRLSCGE